MSSRFLRGAPLGYLVATLGVVAGTAVLWVLRSELSNAHTGLVYLLLVATAATAGGTRPGVLAAFLSFFLWNFFFLPPIFTFVVADPRDWILLLVFLAIGLLIGQITGRLRAREEEAVARERDTAALYQAIQAAAAESNLDAVLTTLVEQVRGSTGALVCAIVDGATLSPMAVSGSLDLQQDEDLRKLVRGSLVASKAIGLVHPPVDVPNPEAWPVTVEHSAILGYPVSRSDVILPVNTIDRTFGVLYARPQPSRSFSVADSRIMLALASQAATFLERKRLIDEAAELAGARETERLKSVLFSSLSHNLKTPLASLAATLSSLRESDVDWDTKSLRDGFGMMAEDVSRLTENIDNLLSLAQLEGGSWQPEREGFEPREIISMALRHFPESEYQRIQIVSPKEMALVWVDAVQMSQALHHIIENALIYSPPDSRVVVEARVEGKDLEFVVDDSGPGIHSPEQEMIFRKFYRGEAASAKAIRGTGLGLAICKEVVQAHGGNVLVERSPQGGSRFRIVLHNDSRQPENRPEDVTIP